MADNDTIRRQRKTWQQRNSDGRDTFTGLRSFNPPTITETEATLPVPASKRFANPAAHSDPRALVHTHDYDDTLVDPDA